MRVDKFLWCVRYFKTRSVATEACKQGKVRMNEAIVKPSREVFATDQIQVRKNQINYQIEVLDIPKSRVGAKLVNLYINDITPQEELEKRELLKYSQDYYRKKGTGRPTKKDRRELDDWFDPEDNDD
ncbi:RNA-binding S4 domain-containing protein [Salinimicrobium sp. MT39]|uniref:RNA-binding S4 domain-containing protein n=1 Tax=Salinimicrobium profundisediminis TaxID=2994553 RepID=A0A9X3CXM7_9FLAO|nr:RNA-binding S4 domain-containing protein [Salinimicrobium profundisediminis]MCX2838676.1 RNA-binding S4 domain-containing protein [Salinimicrobium profundisediminis]